MYWRIKKITPEIIARQYSIHAFFIVSLLFNLVLFSKLGPAKALNGGQKDDMGRFARQVTQHIFDANYLTFPDSMRSLVDSSSGELFGPALAKLRSDGTLPKDSDELKALTRQLQDTKSVSCIKFYGVEVGNPDGKSSFVPVELKMKVIVHDTTGVRPSAMRVKYMVAQATNKQTNTSRNVMYDLQIQPINEQDLMQPSPEGGPFVGGGG
jgi:hypothetical protein